MTVLPFLHSHISSLSPVPGAVLAGKKTELRVIAVSSCDAGVRDSSDVPAVSRVEVVFEYESCYYQVRGVLLENGEHRWNLGTVSMMTVENPEGRNAPLAAGDIWGGDGLEQFMERKSNG